MKLHATRLLFPLVLALAFAPKASADDDMVPLFNGKDLSGWVRVNTAPDTFTARDGIIVTTGVPTGFMRSEKMYENFILEVDWKHLKEPGNSGIFVWGDALPARGLPFTRGHEVQVLVGMNTENYTSHGDLFSIHGATCKPDRPHPKGAMRCLPSERLCKGANEWNHYRVECNNGAIKLAVNGKVVSGLSDCKPRKGYLCLESEGTECHFRNLRIKELPSTHPKPEEISEADPGYHSIFTGLDLAGWRQDKGHEGHWKAMTGPTLLNYDGKSEAIDKNLWTEKEYGDFVMVCDWRMSNKPEKRNRPVILPNGDEAMEDGKAKEIEVDDAGESGMYLRGNTKTLIDIWPAPIGSGGIQGYRIDRSLPAEVRAGATPKEKADSPVGKWNRYVITMKGDRLTVELNGKRVIENAQLPGVPRKGQIGLHHGSPVQFMNLFVRELP